MIDMRKVVAAANDLDNSIENVNRELRKIATIKCRVKKSPGRSDFQENLTNILQKEELLKNVKSYLSGPRKTVFNLTQEEIDVMDIEEVIRAIKSIQSKKTHTKWQTTNPGDNDEYREACRVENMLKARRAQLEPKVTGVMSRVKLLAYLEVLRICDDLTVDECIEKIEWFVKGGE